MEKARLQNFLHLDLWLHPRSLAHLRQRTKTVHWLPYWGTVDKTGTLGNNSLRPWNTAGRHGLPFSLPRNGLDGKRSHRPARRQYQLRAHYRNLHRHTLLHSTRNPRRHSQHSLVLERKTARETLQLTTGSDCLPAPPDPKRGVTSDLVDSFFAWSERDSLAL